MSNQNLVPYSTYDNKYGYKDDNGEIIIPPVYDDAYEFSEGLALVRSGSFYGYINESNTMIIPFKFIK